MKKLNAAKVVTVNIVAATTTVPRVLSNPFRGKPQSARFYFNTSRKDWMSLSDDEDMKKKFEKWAYKAYQDQRDYR